MYSPLADPSSVNIYSQNQLKKVLSEEARLAQTSTTERAFDPVTLFPSVVEFFVPVGSGENITTFGFWVETTGLLKITIQRNYSGPPTGSAI